MASSAIKYWQDDPMGHRYVWDPSDIEAIFAREFYRSLIGTDALQRLADIRFLGAIDYFIHPSGRQLNRRRHNRLEHTLGVANLALRYAKLTSLSEHDEILLVSAALLHDVGHSPLSHSLEIAFKLIFGIDHHDAGASIILGRAPNGFGASIVELLRSANIDPDRVIELCAGKSSETFNFLFSHPINIDTMEAISRSETYIKSSRASPSPDDLLRALTSQVNSSEQLDNFWELKDRIYKLLIQGPVGLLADYVARSYVERNVHRFTKDDYFKSERELRRSVPELFELLEATRTHLRRSLASASTARSVSFVARRFFVDSSKEPKSPERYRQSKAPHSMKLNELIDLSVGSKAETERFEFE